MNVLLDTHIVVWIFTDDNRLSNKARDIILDPSNKSYYSAASVMEVDWKIRSKNNNLEFSLEQFLEKCDASGLIPAPLKSEHIAMSNQLIWDGDGEEHKDPFDRMLLAQAMVDDMIFMTHDGRIAQFRQECVIQV